MTFVADVRAVLLAAQWFVLLYFIAVNSFYALLLASAVLDLRHHRLVTQDERLTGLLRSRVAPRISVLVPAYREAATIGESIRALLALSYPHLEIVIVNDGSPDETLAVATEQFDLVPIHPVYRRQIATRPIRGLFRSRHHPGLLVADKENGGKADALNAALNLAAGELVCAIDADTLVEPDALMRLVRPFLGDRTVVVAGGTIGVANACTVEHGRVLTVRMPTNPLAGFQAIEYLRAFLFGRVGWNRLGGNLIISGAFGLFRRSAVIDAGGYAQDSIGEDMELVMRLRRKSRERGRPARVVFVPDPVAWTQVPESVAALSRQRDRWHRGLADSLRRHWALLLNPRYGALALVAMPYFVFVELLAPVIEAFGLVNLAAALTFGAINVRFAELFFLAAYGYGIVLTVATIVLEEIHFHRYPRTRDRALALAWALAENCGYRQCTVLWRLRGIVKFLRHRTDWGAMPRRGFAAPKP